MKEGTAGSRMLFGAGGTMSVEASGGADSGAGAGATLFGGEGGEKRGFLAKGSSSGTSGISGTSGSSGASLLIIMSAPSIIVVLVSPSRSRAPRH